jgi:homoserine dehydrogenase
MTKAKSGLKIAIAGLGVVGSEVARQLINRHGDLAIVAGQSLDIVAVSARDRSVDRAFSLDGICCMMMQRNLPRVMMLTSLLK